MRNDTSNLFRYLIENKSENNPHLQGRYFFFNLQNIFFKFSVSRVRNGTNLNSVYNITSFDPPLSKDEPPSIFGSKYNFQLEGVVDCPEFLVHFPTFEKLAERHGLMLICKQRFDRYFNSVSLVTRQKSCAKFLGKFILYYIITQWARKIKKVQAIKLEKFLAVLNFFPVHKLIFGHIVAIAKKIISEIDFTIFFLPGLFNFSGPLCNTRSDTNFKKYIVKS